MKVVFPKNIKKWLLAGMTFQIGPISISIIQLFLLAAGVGLALVAFNAVSKTSGKGLATMVAIPILAIFLIVAFFKISELSLLPYIAKVIRNVFFDITKKFQINYTKNNPTDVLIKKIRETEKKQKIEQKQNKFDKQMVEDIEKWWLIG